MKAKKWRWDFIHIHIVHVICLNIHKSLNSDANDTQSEQGLRSLRVSLYTEHICCKYVGCCGCALQFNVIVYIYDFYGK